MLTSPPFPGPRSPRRRAAASAPMRVSLAGGCSDLPPFVSGVGGRVVGTAIEVRVRALVEPFDRGWVRLETAFDGPGGEGPEGALQAARTRRTGEAPAGDLACRLLEAALAWTGLRDGVRLRVEAELLPGAGLGGSAAAAVALLCALRAAGGETEVPQAPQLAREASQLEREGLGLACGSQDQVFAAHGGLLDLAFDATGCVRLEPLPVAPLVLRGLSRGLLLVDTRRRRVSGDVLRGVTERVAQGAASELAAAAEEVARGFAADSLELVVAGMHRGAAAKVRRDPPASAPAIELGQRLTGLGAEVVRTCGAGGGGHVLVWAPEDRHPALLAALTGFVVRRPALGARGVQVEVGRSAEASEAELATVT